MVNYQCPICNSTRQNPSYCTGSKNRKHKSTERKKHVPEGNMPGFGESHEIRRD